MGHAAGQLAQERQAILVRGALLVLAQLGDVGQHDHRLAAIAGDRGRHRQRARRRADRHCRWRCQRGQPRGRDAGQLLDGVTGLDLAEQGRARGHPRIGQQTPMLIVEHHHADRQIADHSLETTPLLVAHRLDLRHQQRVLDRERGLAGHRHHQLEIRGLEARAVALTVEVDDAQPLGRGVAIEERHHHQRAHILGRQAERSIQRATVGQLGQQQRPRVDHHLAEHVGRDRDRRPAAGAIRGDVPARGARLRIVDDDRAAIGRHQLQQRRQHPLQQQLHVVLDADHPRQLDHRAQPAQLVGLAGAPGHHQAQRDGADQQLVAVAQRGLIDALLADERPVAAAEILDGHRAVGVGGERGVGQRHHRVVDLDLTVGAAADAGPRADGVDPLARDLEQRKTRRGHHA